MKKISANESNNCNVYITTKRILFLYEVKASVIDEDLIYTLDFKKYCTRNEIKIIKSKLAKLNFNRNEQTSGYCYGNSVISNSHVFLEIGGIIFKKINLSPNYCIGKSESGQGRKFVKPVTNEIYKNG